VGVGLVEGELTGVGLGDAVGLGKGEGSGVAVGEGVGPEELLTLPHPAKNDPDKSTRTAVRKDCKRRRLARACMETPEALISRGVLLLR